MVVMWIDVCLLQINSSLKLPVPYELLGTWLFSYSIKHVRYTVSYQDSCTCSDKGSHRKETFRVWIDRRRKSSNLLENRVWTFWLTWVGPLKRKPTCRLHIWMTSCDPPSARHHEIHGCELHLFNQGLLQSHRCKQTSINPVPKYSFNTLVWLEKACTFPHISLSPSILR